MKHWCLFSGIFCVFAMMSPGYAQNSQSQVGNGILVQAFIKAQKNDPLFRASKAEYDSNIIDSKIAATAYYPQLTLSSSQIADEEGDQRHVASLIQPLISADKFATLKEKEPRSQIARTTFKLRQYELATRLYVLFSDLTEAREGLEQNKARLKALQLQYDAGKRTFELGQGTITDMTDARVKMLQAEADDLKLKNELEAAEKQYLSIVGETPPEFRLSKSLNPVISTGHTTDSGLGQNAEVMLANLNRRLAELDTVRAKSAWIPELNASYTYTLLDGDQDSFVGFSLSMPISAGTIFGTQSATSKLARLNEEALAKQRQARLEIQQLKSAVESGLSELATRKRAIEAAELSVTSNEKSYKGGVRSLLDVLTSIDVLYSMQADYVRSVLELGENLLNLRIQQGREVIQSLSDVEQTVLVLNQRGA